MNTVKPGFLFFLTEFRKFIRVETCTVVVCIALSGYLIFNNLGIGMLLLAVAMFFATGASYACNHLTDKKEDVINNKGLNLFVTNGMGYYIILGFMAISIVSALQMHMLPFSIYLICVVAGFAYSIFRIKGIFPIKNIYTGLSMAAPFLIGATSGNHLILGMIPYFLLIFLIGTTSNLIGDVRGYVGDKMTGLKTIPVAIGVKASKWIIHLNMIVFSFATIMLGYLVFVPMIPSLAAASFFLNRDDHKSTKSSMILTFLLLISAILTMEILGV